MIFKNINIAREHLVKSILMHHKAAEQGDVKIGNKEMMKTIEITNYIDENYGLEEMKNLLDHENPNVQVWTAKSLLSIYEEIAIRVLEEIVSRDIPFTSFSASVILSEWKGEPLKF